MKQIYYYFFILFQTKGELNAEKKEKFDKGKQKFSKEIYTINKKEGYKILVNGTSRKLKPSELLKAG